MDVQKSTSAATNYLTDLHAEFGDWPLAFAAYNAGAQSVRTAMSNGKGRDFARLSSQGLLPGETREYVPAVYAAASLLRGSNPPMIGGADNRDLWVLFAKSSKEE